MAGAEERGGMGGKGRIQWKRGKQLNRTYATTATEERMKDSDRLDAVGGMKNGEQWGGWGAVGRAT